MATIQLTLRRTFSLTCGVCSKTMTALYVKYSKVLAEVLLERSHITDRRYSMKEYI